MKLISDIADSIVWAGFNILLAVAGFVLLMTPWAILSIAVFWCALPMGLFLSLGFLVRDLRKKELCRQAKVAALISLPLIVYEIWLLGFTRLDI